MQVQSPYRILIPLKLNPNENILTLFFSPSQELVTKKTDEDSMKDFSFIMKSHVSKVSINTDSDEFIIEKLS